jgi:hypothetical protein
MNGHRLKTGTGSEPIWAWLEKCALLRGACPSFETMPMNGV